jgi:hypothetical protein
MINEVRWRAERAKMRQAFPEFRPFEDGRRGLVGFAGRLRLPGGRVHEVTISAGSETYPALPPKVFIRPFVGGHRLVDGSLCLHRRWRPALDTFAQQLLYAIKYLTQH